MKEKEKTKMSELSQKILATILSKSRAGNCYDIEPTRTAIATEKQFKYIKGFLKRTDLIGEHYDSYAPVIDGWKLKASDCRWTPYWEITFYKLSPKEADEAWEKELDREDAEYLAKLNSK